MQKKLCWRLNCWINQKNHNRVQDKIFNTTCFERQFWQARLLTYHTYNAYLFKSNLIHNVIFIQLTACCLSQNLFRLTFLNTKIKHNLDQQTIYTVWTDEFTLNIVLKWTRSYRFRSVISIKMFKEKMYAVFLNKTAFHLTFSKKTWSRGWRLPIWRRLP